MELCTLPIEQIKEGLRFREEYGDLKELIVSIKKDGIIQPLAVRRCSDGSFDLCAGGRRLRAAKECGLTIVPVRVYPEDMSDLQLRTVELMENIIRKDLTWWEKSKLMQEINRLQVAIHGEKKSTSPNAPGWSKAMTAEMLGVSEATVSEEIQLANHLDLIPGLKEAKNRAEARKVIKNVEEALILEELSKRIQNKTAETGLERRQAEICNRYIVGNFFDLVKQVPDRSIDLIELDPPYGIMLTKQKEGLSNNFYNADNYNEVDFLQYIPFMKEVLFQCFRTMSENSWLVMWFGPDPWFDILHKIVIEVGFKGSMIPGIWAKPTGQTLSPATNLANSYEMFFYARKGSPIIGKQGRSNVFNFKGINPQYKTHPTERPIEMIQEVLATFGWTGARVLVPFLGSGNTILAAENLNMQAFGFELSESYKNPFVLKVTSSQPGQYRSYRGGDEDVTF
jgi:ParB/RepB/Spo0J family partition protein